MYLKEKTLSKLYFTALQGNKLWNNIVADYFLKDFVFFSLILEKKWVFGLGIIQRKEYLWGELVPFKWSFLKKVLFVKTDNLATIVT